MLRVKRLTDKAILPFRATAGSVGYDLFCAAACVVPANGKEMVNTGLSMAIPVHHYGRVAPRSSLAWKNHIDVGAGVIDSDYRGEVKVILFNHSKDDFIVNEGDKIAQLIIEKVALPEVVEVADIDNTERGEGGFGSTGANCKEGNGHVPNKRKLESNQDDEREGDETNGRAGTEEEGGETKTEKARKKLRLSNGPQ